MGFVPRYSYLSQRSEPWQFSTTRPPFKEGTARPLKVGKNAGHYGSGFAGTSVGSASHATHPVLAEAEGSIGGLASRTPPRKGDSGLCISPGLLEGPLLAKERCDLRHSAQKEGVLMLIRSDSRSIVSYINHQGGFVSKRLCTLVNYLLVWAQNNLRSLKATHVPGKMNQGADMLSRKNISSEEWTLHPLTVQRIWETFGKVRVDLFASKDDSHCPIFFTRSTDALAHEWPSLPLCAFPPVALLPQVLRRVREQRPKLILIEPTVGFRVIPAAESWKQLHGRSPWDGASSLEQTAWYGIHDPSYGPCMCCRSTGAFHPPRACPKHYGRS